MRIKLNSYVSSVLEGVQDAKGFLEPNYTQVPNELMDRWLPDLSGGELKVLLYLIRRTLGFHRNIVEIGLRRIRDGVPGKDRGTGLNLETISAAIKNLEAKGLVITNRESGARTTYTLPISIEVYGKSKQRRTENPDTKVCGKSAHEEKKNTTEKKEKSSPSPPTMELIRTTREEEERLYAAFKRLYPSHRFDEGKARLLFERLSIQERTSAIERLRQHLACPRWLKSLADDGGRFVPFASNWLKSWDSDPPPLFIKPVDGSEAKQIESISRVAELTRAYQRRMR